MTYYEDHIMKTDLIKKRNWTEARIKKFLGKADVEKRNPHRNNRPLQLFSMERVEAAERSKEFKRCQRELKTRRKNLKDSNAWIKSYMSRISNQLAAQRSEAKASSAKS